MRPDPVSIRIPLMVAILFTGSLLLAACGKSSDTAPPPPPPPNSSNARSDATLDSLKQSAVQAANTDNVTVDATVDSDNASDVGGAVGDSVDTDSGATSGTASMAAQALATALRKGTVAGIEAQLQAVRNATLSPQAQPWVTRTITFPGNPVSCYNNEGTVTITGSGTATGPDSATANPYTLTVDLSNVQLHFDGCNNGKGYKVWGSALINSDYTATVSYTETTENMDLSFDQYFDGGFVVQDLSPTAPAVYSFILRWNTTGTFSLAANRNPLQITSLSGSATTTLTVGNQTCTGTTELANGSLTKKWTCGP